MSFTEAVRICLSKYVSIEGRARRAEYWWFLLFTLLCSIAAGLVDRILFGPETSILSGTVSLGLFLPTICVAIRRLHDRDMSGWWVLLNIIPLIGSLILFVIYLFPGTEGANRFGPDPLRGDQGGMGGGGEDDAVYATSSFPRTGQE